MSLVYNKFEITFYFSAKKKKKKKNENIIWCNLIGR